MTTTGGHSHSHSHDAGDELQASDDDAITLEVFENVDSCTRLVAEIGACFLI